jgi:hypothetical protein
VALLIGLAVFWYVWLEPPPDDLAEKFARIQVGMTCEEVASIMGSAGSIDDPKPVMYELCRADQFRHWGKLRQNRLGTAPK